MAEGQQMLDRAARAGHVVDIDAGHGHPGQGALDDDRESRRAISAASDGSSTRGPDTTRPSACCARSSDV